MLSCTTTVNPGFLGDRVRVGDRRLPRGRHGTIGLKGVIAGFATELFLTVVGVTVLFAAAQGNGTLDRVARVAVRGCRGNAGLIPLAFFGLALGHRLVRCGQHRGRRPGRPPGHVGGCPGGGVLSPFLMTLMVSATARWPAPLAVRSLGARRRRPDGAAWPAGARLAYLPEQCRRQRCRRRARVRRLRRLEAPGPAGKIPPNLTRDRHRAGTVQTARSCRHAGAHRGPGPPYDRFQGPCRVGQLRSDRGDRPDIRRPGR